ncbi:MAG: HAMP domain-containing sensor histidine kinase [bacterium]|nr:HAMP domain-containing sensor histidine kinase [bacterium]
MDYNLLENLQFCGQIVADSSALLYYTHIPSAVIAIFIGAYVLYKTRALSGVLLFGISLVFSLWVTLNLFIWLEFDNNAVMITLWSVLGLLSVLLCFLTHWFTHEFMAEKPLPLWVLAMWAILIAPVAIFTPTSFNLSGVDIQQCVSVEGHNFLNYYYLVGVLTMIFASISAFYARNISPSKKIAPAKWLIFAGVQLFLLSFLTTGFVASYLVDSGLIPDFGLEQYGVATMAVFMGFLAYATVRYHAFNLKLLAAQALVLSLVALIASEFLFVTSAINQILVGLTLGLAVIFGFFLVRSVKAEVLQRELIQKQEEELEAVNKQQEGLLHFISHEIKGYLSKNEAGFAAIAEGDYGTVSVSLKEMAASALQDTRRGVETVMDILDASNLKKGTVAYDKKSFDFPKAIQEVVNSLKPMAQEKGISLEYTDSTGGSAKINGDENKLCHHVIRNLIDNSIRYTPSGSVKVSVDKGGSVLRMTVADTGVGISPEDMKKLFTEGGRGADSIKVNVHSTGYGLFIAKTIVEAHGGKIRAESEGKGKGSRFIVELPAV